jgi:hypothetical protein
MIETKGKNMLNPKPANIGAQIQHRHMGFEGTNPDIYIPMRYCGVVQSGLSPQTSSSS